MTETTKHDNSSRELIAFRIGEQEFCVDIMSVREIRGWAPATGQPHSPHPQPAAQLPPQTPCLQPAAHLG